MLVLGGERLAWVVEVLVGHLAVVAGVAFKVDDILDLGVDFFGEEAQDLVEVFGQQRVVEGELGLQDGAPLLGGDGDAGGVGDDAVVVFQIGAESVKPLWQQVVDA